MTRWNKLVRDKIPQIIEAGGGMAKVEELDDGRFEVELLKKLAEEAAEAQNADKKHLLEELGDVESVVDTLLEINGWTRQELRKQQKAKDKKRGTFKKRLFLIKTKGK